MDLQASLTRSPIPLLVIVAPEIPSKVSFTVKLSDDFLPLMLGDLAYGRSIRPIQSSCDVNGDGIHALMDRKTYLQGLSTYARGGHPVYEFARFY